MNAANPLALLEDVRQDAKTYVSDTRTSSSEGVHLRLVPASAVKPERVRWAWDSRIPLGMVSLLVGEGGLGKSTLGVHLAAGWSRGTISGDLEGARVPVAIATAEDHRSAVVVPRLLAAGADLRCISFPEIVDEDGAVADLAIDGQVDELERTLSDAGTRVLIIDTVVAHIPAAFDSHKEQSVRGVLKPLAHLAERCGIAVLGTMHLNRRDARDVLTRINGSGAFGNLARSVLVFAHDPDDLDGPTRILAVGKSNVGARPSAVRLRLQPTLVPVDDGPPISAPRIAMEGDTQHTARELLGSADDEERSVVEEAVAFLRDLLANGPVAAKRVQEEAKAAGVSGMLRRAQRQLGIKPRKLGMSSGWVWGLPVDDEESHQPLEPRTSVVHVSDEGDEGLAL